MSTIKTTFFPGPSQLYPEIGSYLQEAYSSGILSMSHRSKVFDQLSQETIALLHDRLAIPADYLIFYTSSATESWEIIPQSLTKTGGFHLYSGSFGQKWYEYAKKLKPGSLGQQFDVNEALSLDSFIPAKDAELICLTQNETSNGSQISSELLTLIRNQFPEKLIAVDVTSSINGISLPFDQADIWYGSVQKCFGMPAGLGLLICSPRAMDRAQEIGEKSHYNSLLTLAEHMKKYQTTCTPNVLGIFLMNSVLKNNAAVSKRENQLIDRSVEMYKLLDESAKSDGRLTPLVSTADNRSRTVVTISCEANYMADLKELSKNQGYLLGNGYGQWKDNTFRLANFPAVSDLAWDWALEFVKNNA